MIKRMFEAIFSTDIVVTVSPNRVRVENPSARKAATIDAPFSCSHLIVSDFDILEEALGEGLRKLGLSPWFTFPRMIISVADRETHMIERRAMRDAAMNAGASQVEFDHGRSCSEGQSERNAYVEAINRRR